MGEIVGRLWHGWLLILLVDQIISELNLKNLIIIEVGYSTKVDQDWDNNWQRY